MAETVLKDFPTLFSLKGKVALVTGGSRGLGLHAASALLQAGCKTVLITSRKSSACSAACEALNALPNLSPGARAIPLPADSSTEAGILDLLAQARKHVSHIDILLANAGASWGAPLESHSDAAFAKVMDLNVRAVFNTVKLFQPLLRAKATLEDPSRVIVTASVAGLGVSSLGANATFGYAASKAAVIHLARNLALELAPRGITVNALAPGFFPSKMSNGLMELGGGQEKLALQNPTGRLGRPEDIAGAVVYLASRAGSHVNGTVLPIDGGAMWSTGQLNIRRPNL